MNILSVLATVCLVSLCGCQTSPPIQNTSDQRGELSVAISIGDMTGDLRTARIYIDDAFAGNYEEGILFDLPSGTHKIAVEIPRVSEVRRRPDGGSSVTTYKLTGEEVLIIFGGQSVQRLTLSLDNMKRTEIDDDGH